MSYPILRSSLSSQTCTGLRLIIASHTELRYLGIPLKYLCSVLFHLRGNSFSAAICWTARMPLIAFKTVHASKSALWIRLLFFMPLFGVSPQSVPLFLTIPLAPLPRASPVPVRVPSLTVPLERNYHLSHTTLKP